MGASVDLALDCAKKGYELIKKSAQPLFIDLLKVNALGTVMSMAGILIAGLLLFMLAGAWVSAQLTQASPTAPDGTVYFVLAVSLVVLLAGSLLSRAATAVSYNIVENTTKGRRTGIMEQFMKNLVPVSVLSIIVWIVMLVLALPLILSIQMGEAAAGATCVFGLVSTVLLLLFGFFTQFAIFEVVLGGRNAVEAIKRSFSLVKANVWAVLLLDLFMAVVGFAAYAVTQVAQLILQPIPVALSLTGFQGIFIGYAIYMLLLIIFGLFIGAATDLITIPILYNFWQRVKS